MSKTKIEWATDVWNIVTGCTPKSEGCKNCWAKRMAKRLAGRCGYPPMPDQFRVTLHPERLDEPLHWKRPRRIFVCSMGDLFHKDVPIQFIAGVWTRMILTPQHTYLILTKRPEAMFDIVPNLFYNYFENEPTIRPNVWLGVSVEDQETADERIPLLLQTPAAVRFVSVEPMLGPVSLAGLEGNIYRPWLDTYAWKARKIHLVICGCESGPGARPMELDWARSLRDQCQAAGVPFFLKQAMIGGKLVKMPELDGKVWDEIPGKEK